VHARPLTYRRARSLGLQIDVVAALALAENAIGARAVKPHAVLKTAKGTVEVGNTDAEGRLCLGDAFTYVQNKYAPSEMIDLATLTGCALLALLCSFLTRSCGSACVVALGEYAAGVFSNDHEMARTLVRAGK
jgi:leucyl aminopeptidase